MVKVIVFDCWGTLFYDDITPKPFEAFAAMIGKSMEDYSFLKVFEKNLMLKRCDDIKEGVIGVLRDLGITPDKKLVRELVRILEIASEHIKPFPKTFETLERLRKKYKLVLLSNAFSPTFEALDKKYKIREKFNLVLLSYELGMLKPDPRLLNIVLKKFNCKKEDLLLVGDNLNDDFMFAEKFGSKGILFDPFDKYSISRKISSLDKLFDVI